MAKKFGRTSLLSADALALAVVVEPSCVSRAESHYLMVEIGGLYARGQTIVDWNDRMGKAPNASIVLDVDLDRFHALFEAGLV